MEGEFKRVFRILLRLSLKKLLAKQPLGVIAQGSVSPAAGPVPHAPTTALGTAKISSKHMSRRPVYEAIRLTGKVILFVMLILFMVIPMRFLMSLIISPEFLWLDYIRAPLAHSLWLLIIGFTLFPFSLLALAANVHVRTIRSLIYPSQIKRKHIEMYNLAITEITLFAISMIISASAVYILWGVLVNPAAFLVLFFLGIFLAMNIVINVFSLLPVVYRFGKSKIGYYGSFLFHTGLFLVLFSPMFLIMYKTYPEGELKGLFTTIIQDPIARFAFMLPDAILILISQDAPLAFKVAITLLLAGIATTSTGISYTLHKQVSSVAWKERYAFHRGSKNLDKRIKSTKKNKPPRGWDAVEVKGLDIFSRMPQKKISEQVIHDRDFYIAAAILVSAFSTLVFLTQASPFLLFYLFLAVPLFILYPVLQNLNLILSKDGLKFFKLIPESPQKISSYFRRSIERHSLYASVLFVAILYFPLLVIASLEAYHIVIAVMAILHLFVFFTLIFSLFVISDLKDGASPIKGHSLVKFFLPMYSTVKRESRMWFAVKDNLAIMGAVVLMMLLVLIFLFLPYIVILLFRLDNYIPLVLHVVMILAIYLFVRTSLVDNILAYLSFNKKRLNKLTKIIPLAIAVCYFVLEMVFIMLFVNGIP